MVPLANIITPNQFEVEQLTGCVIKTEAEASVPFKAFHDLGVQTVVMTSLEGQCCRRLLTSFALPYPSLHSWRASASYVGVIL